MKRIFLDMDGVLCDFCSGATLAAGFDPSVVLANYPKGEWDLEKVLGISSSQLWKAIDEKGIDFWAKLKPFKHTSTLISLCHLVCPEVGVLTNPGGKGDAVVGKQLWLDKFFGFKFQNVVFTKQKFLLARSDMDLLVDDKPQMINDFKRAGGSAFLWSQPWNEGTSENNILSFIEFLRVNWPETTSNKFFNKLPQFLDILQQEDARYQDLLKRFS